MKINNSKSIKMKTLFFQVILFISISQLFSQVRLDVEGDAKIEGLLQLTATPVDSSIFIGFNAGKKDDGTFKENVFIGNNAGERNSSGADNVFVGATAGKLNQTGTFNTFIGGNAGEGNSSGSNNVFVGYVAGTSNSSGGANTYIGRFAGQNTKTNSFCTFLGFNTGHPDGSTSYNNSMALGFDARVTADNYIAIGNTDITSIKGQVNFTTFSDGRFKRRIREDIPGLDFILKLRPVTYQVEKNKMASFLGETEKNKSRNNNQQLIRYSGFIAQEVEKVANQINYDFSGVDKPRNEKSLYGIRYAEFVVPLVKSIQEQQEVIDQLDSKIGERDKRIDKLESEVLELKRLMRKVINSSEKNITQTSIIESAKIGQNIPNPFSSTTKIPYNIPQKSHTAIIKVHNLSGHLIKAVKINSFGKGMLELETNGFVNGQYSYTLEVDGRVIETKKMNFNNK